MCLHCLCSGNYGFPLSVECEYQTASIAFYPILQSGYRRDCNQKPSSILFVSVGSFPCHLRHCIKVRVVRFWRRLHKFGGKLFILTSAVIERVRPSAYADSSQVVRRVPSHRFVRFLRLSCPHHGLPLLLSSILRLSIIKGLHRRSRRIGSSCQGRPAIGKPNPASCFTYIWKDASDISLAVIAP